MPLPQITVDGRVNPQAMIFACRSIMEIGFRNEQDSAIIARSVGAEQVFWRNNADSVFADVSFFRDSDILWINIHGTENPPDILKVLQGAGFLATFPFFPTGIGTVPAPSGTGGLQQLLAYLSTPFPFYDKNVGAYVMGWVQLQGYRLLEDIHDELEKGLPRQIIITGHSLGGAIANYVSRVVANALTPGEPIRLVDRIVMSDAFSPIAATLLGLYSYRRQRDEFQRRLLGNPVPIDVLTFGEPRSVGPGADFSPRSHYRIIGTAGLSRPRFPNDAFRAIDFVTLLPLNAAVAPGPGLLTGIPWARTVAVKVGLGVTPVHSGTPIYITSRGIITEDPLSFIRRFLNEIVTSLLTTLDQGTLSLHLLQSTYLPASEGLLRLTSQDDPIVTAQIAVVGRGSSSRYSDIQNQQLLRETGMDPIGDALAFNAISTVMEYMVNANTLTSIQRNFVLLAFRQANNASRFLDLATLGPPNGISPQLANALIGIGIYVIAMDTPRRQRESGALISQIPPPINPNVEGGFSVGQQQQQPSVFDNSVYQSSDYFSGGNVGQQLPPPPMVDNSLPAIQGPAADLVPTPTTNQQPTPYGYQRRERR
jgi:Lipase (class 3)